MYTKVNLEFIILIDILINILIDIIIISIMNPFPFSYLSNFNFNMACGIVWHWGDVRASGVHHDSLTHPIHTEIQFFIF